VSSTTETLSGATAQRARASQPFHTFLHNGDYVLYDAATSTVALVDETAYDLLRLLESGWGVRDAIRQLAGKHPAADLERAAREWQAIQRKGGVAARQFPAWNRGHAERMVARYARWPSPGVELFVAESCNFRCRYCYASDNQVLDGGFMPSDIGEQAVRFAFRRSGPLGHVNFCFFGGEPLLNFEGIKHLTRLARDLGRRHRKRVRFSITTNGSLLRPEVVQWLKQYEFSVTLSIDGPPDVHDRLRPFADGRSSSDAVQRGIRALQDVDIKPLLRCTVTSLCPSGQILAPFLQSFGTGKVQLTRSEGRADTRDYLDIGPVHWPALHEDEEQMAQNLRESIGSTHPSVYNPFAHALSNIHYARAPLLPCGASRGVTSVGIDGRLYPCHRYVGMEDWVIGDIWGGVDRETHVKFLRGFFGARSRCAACWAWNVCELRCPWYLSCDDGSFRAVPQWRCEEEMRAAERRIWLYAVLARDHPRYLATELGCQTATDDC
jgi:uncharacterized protein